jgi:hypothetical protein
VFLVAGLVAGVAVIGAATAFLGFEDETAGPSDATVQLPDEVTGRGADDTVPPTDTLPTADAPECVQPGCLAWWVPIRGAANTPVLGRQDELLLLAEQRHLAGIDTSRGDLRWRTPVDVGDGHVGVIDLATTEAEVLLIGRDGFLRSIGLDDGRTRWRRVVGDAVRVTQAEVVDDQLLIVTNERVPGGTQALRALDPELGEVRWTIPVDGRIALTGAGPVVADVDGTVWGAEPVDGSVRWEERIDGELDRVASFHGWVVLAAQQATTVLDAVDGSWVATFPHVGSIQTLGTGQEALVLLGEEEVTYLEPDGQAWTVPLPGPCCQGVALTSTSLRLLRADGRVTDLLRADGGQAIEWSLSEVLEGDAGHLLGSYLFTGSSQSGDLAVHDVVSGAPVADLPGTRFPVGLSEEGELILVGARGVAGLTALPDRSPGT